MIDEQTKARLYNQCAAADQAESPEYDQYTPEDEAPEGMNTEDLINTLGNLVFGVMCPNWNVTQQEVAGIAGPAAEVIEKYYPEGVSTKFGPEIALASAAALVIYPRLGVPRKLEEKEVNPKEETKGEPKPQPKPRKNDSPEQKPGEVISLD